MIIGFTGTRNINAISTERLESLKESILRLRDNLTNIDLEESFSVVHGGALGMDECVHNFCIDNNIKIAIRFGGDYKRKLNGEYLSYEPEAYLKRNKKIVDDCDILIAVPVNPDVEELRSGTWSTIRYGKKQNKIIHIF